MNQQIILGLLRHVLTTVGGIMVSKGYIDAGGLESLIGGALTAAGAAWSIYHKTHTPDGPVVTVNPVNNTK